jgi:putative adhesin
VTSAAHAHHLTPWGRLVAVSSVLVLAFLITLGALAAASTRRRVVSYPVSGALNGVALDLGDADVVVERGARGRTVDVQRTERFAFGHNARTHREVSGGVFHASSRCPSTVLHACAVSFRVVVPDSVPIDVRTTSGTIRLDGYRGSARLATRSGDIAITSYCGFSLQARSERGDISANAACAPQLSLRATSGSVHVVVPAGRYRVDAETAAGRRTVRGITEATNAPFSIQAFSSAGDILVEGRQ